VFVPNPRLGDLPVRVNGTVGRSMARNVRDMRCWVTSNAPQQFQFSSGEGTEGRVGRPLGGGEEEVPGRCRAGGHDK
jgi:hypothetical protein